MGHPALQLGAGRFVMQLRGVEMCRRDSVVGLSAVTILSHGAAACGRAVARPRCCRSVASLLSLCLVLLASQGHAQQPDTVASPGALKRLTLEHLMNLQVTSCSNRPPRLSQAASAIPVIPQDGMLRA